MVQYPTILNLPQEDINRQLYEMILKLKAVENGATVDIDAIKKDIEDIQGEIGTDTKADTIKGRIKALETAT